MQVVGRAPFEASAEGRWIYKEAPLEYQDVHDAAVTENTLVEVISKPGPMEPIPNPFDAPN